MNVEHTIAERDKTYGEYKYQAQITQALKTVMRAPHGWDRLSASQKEALEMIASKIARILNGNPNYSDSWHDIAGYSALIEKQLSPMPGSLTGGNAMQHHPQQGPATKNALDPA